MSDEEKKTISYKITPAALYGLSLMRWASLMRDGRHPFDDDDDDWDDEDNEVYEEGNTPDKTQFRRENL